MQFRGRHAPREISPPVVIYARGKACNRPRTAQAHTTFTLLIARSQPIMSLFYTWPTHDKGISAIEVVSFCIV